MTNPAPRTHDWRRALRWLLVVAHVFVALALFSLQATYERRPGNVLISLWLGCAGGQIFVAAAWAVLRPAPLPWRLATAAIPTLAWVGNIGHARNGNYDVWLAYLLPVAVSAAACAGAMRFVNGCQLVSAEEAASWGPARNQYSLRTLMLLMTAAAVLCAILELLMRPWLRYYDEMLPFLAATMLSGSAMLLAWFRADRLGLQRIMSCLAALTAGTTLRLLESPIDLEQSLLLSSIECTILAVTFQVWRTSGLRLQPGFEMQESNDHDGVQSAT